jgi:hypothetical protein
VRSRAISSRRSRIGELALARVAASALREREARLAAAQVRLAASAADVFELMRRFSRD